MPKEELQEEIKKEISEIRKRIETTWSSYESDAMNRVALSNLYIALSNLMK